MITNGMHGHIATETYINKTVMIWVIKDIFYVWS